MGASGNGLGRLSRVDLRDIWVSESSDFTPWLARDENLEILGETLGIDLELEAQEKSVGPFRADILCKDIGTGSWVLVENQDEQDWPRQHEWLAAKVNDFHKVFLNRVRDLDADEWQKEREAGGASGQEATQV